MPRICFPWDWIKTSFSPRTSGGPPHLLQLPDQSQGCPRRFEEWVLYFLSWTSSVWFTGTLTGVDACSILHVDLPSFSLLVPPSCRLSSQAGHTGERAASGSANRISSCVGYKVNTTERRLSPDVMSTCAVLQFGGIQLVWHPSSQKWMVSVFHVRRCSLEINGFQSEFFFGKQVPELIYFE